MLVVEDEIMISMLLEDMLSDMGCIPVGPAARIESALKLIENAKFDAAILDANLNGRESYPVADALAARAIPFVFASGHSAARRPEKYWGVPSLEKPFQQDDLQRALAAALSGRPMS